MAFGFNSFFKAGKKQARQEIHQEFSATKESTGYVITYTQNPDESVIVSAISVDAPTAEVTFSATASDEANIIYRQACELLRSRAAIGQDRAAINNAVEKLFASYRR
jgi:predicted ATPase